MRRWWIKAITAVIFGSVLGIAAQAQTPVGQPTSEGHPSKWQAIDKSLFDLVSDGYTLVSVAYDTSETEPKAEPDVHYFLQKGNVVAKCVFRKRGQTSFYWCYQLAKASGQ
ncbi:MAG TPA: hypothetical protein VNV38_04330 [Stellaceae bacterium]|jgi:hypothetical protein|nr:hypothetical protein [Stellaceae bacterium]